MMAALLGAFVAGMPAQAEIALDLNRLDESAIRLVEETIKTLEPLVTARKQAGTLPLITLDELYAPLTAEQRVLLDAIRAVDPAQMQGSSRRLPWPSPEARFVRLQRQVIGARHPFEKVPDTTAPHLLDDQYLPQPVYRAYRRMMRAMQRDIGKRLLVESGYRSPAHQLYLFLFYLPKHGYSIRETNRFVALPGCSEHGSPARQAIDFINEEGVNGEDHPEEFETLPEYAWLQAHAHEYGFYLSYPRNHPTNSAFEPWHWHYENGDK